MQFVIFYTYSTKKAVYGENGFHLGKPSAQEVAMNQFGLI